MTRQPRAFFALDHGSATTSAALIAHVGERWRLVAHAASPATADSDALIASVVERVRAADPELLAEIAPDGSATPPDLAAAFPRLETRTAPRQKLAVLAASERTAGLLEIAARRAGWETVTGSADVDDPLQLSRLALSPDTAAILVGAADPPAGEEKHVLRQLAAVVAAAISRRADLQLILSGGAAQRADTFRISEHASHHHAFGHRVGHEEGAATEAAASQAGGIAAGEASAASAPGATPPAENRPAERTGYMVLAPDAEAGQPHGSALQSVLEGLRATSEDSRLAIVRSIRSLAYVLDRSVEAVEVGLDASMRCRAEPLPGEGHKEVGEVHAVLAGGGFAPSDPSETLLDAVQGWSSVPLDRHRLADRLRDLRLAPWGDAGEDGAQLKLAAARAALEALVEATPGISARPAPDLLVMAGGVWQSVPPPVVSLALADLVRRSGASQLALDVAQLLGPLGMIEDEEERRQMLADLADDALLPLGSLIVPAGLRLGRNAGTLRLRNGHALAELDLEPGSIEVIDLAAGQTAVADLEFHDTVLLGVRGRHFSTEVSGGLSGLLVDLRDVPLRLPERADERRGLLDSWQRALWPELES